MCCWAKLKPAEPFITTYLIGPYKNISEEVVTNYLFPIWTVIPPARYLRSAILTGSTLGQLLVSLAGLDYLYLNAISLGILSVAFLISVLLPIPQRGMFFRGEKAVLDLTNSVGSMIASRKGGRKDAVYKYLNSLQVFTQDLKKEIIHCCCPIGAATAFCVGHVKVTWNVWGELSLRVFSPVGAGAVFLIGLTSKIWASYAGNIIFKASCSNLFMACYGEVNTFVALLLQTILTAIVVEETALGLDIFVVYGSYYAAISELFLIRGMYTVCEQKDETKVEVPSSDRYSRLQDKHFNVLSSYS
uniref:Solute carrier family 19 member 3b n=1 Tax=Oncorhynchus kisutch TaxID=8019 RepID=A0A8C7D138_ONCKI